MAIGLVSAKMGLQGRSQFDSVLMDILFQIKKVFFSGPGTSNALYAKYGKNEDIFQILLE